MVASMPLARNWTFVHVRLQTNDFVFVPSRGKTVAISGAVRRPAVFELKDDENFNSLLDFAGGLLPDAYTKRFQIERIVPFTERTDPSIARQVIDLSLAEVLEGRSAITLRDGDRAGLFVLPAGLTIGLLVLGLWLSRRALVALALALLWLSSTPLVSGGLMAALEPAGGRQAAADMPTADAIVVLSTGRTQAPGPERVSEWSDADRFFGGMELMKAQRAPVIVFTGGVSSSSPLSQLEGDVLRTYASGFGLPDSSILVTGSGRSRRSEPLPCGPCVSRRRLPR